MAGALGRAATWAVRGDVPVTPVTRALWRTYGRPAQPPAGASPTTPAPGGLDLLEEGRGTDDGRELRTHDLNGDFATVPWVVREIDGGHAAGTQLPLERVAFGQVD